MFGRKSYETPAEAGVEAPTPAESRPKRERPNYAALAEQRSQAISQKTGSLRERLGKWAKNAKDFVLTIDSRTAHRVGRTKDLGVDAGRAVGRTAVAGAEAVGERFVSGRKAIDRRAEATLEFGVGAAEVGIEAVGRAGTATKEFGVRMAAAGFDAVGTGLDYVNRKGEKGAMMVMDGINSGIESSQNTYRGVITGITERYGKAREALQNRADMRAFAADQKKLGEYKAKVALIEAKAGLKQANMAEIQQRLAARGITREESEPSEFAAAA